MSETIRVLQPGLQDTDYKVSGFGAATTAGSAPASVSTTAIITTVDAMSGPPWPTHRPLTTLLLGLNEDSGVPSGFGIDPDTTLAALSR